GSLFSTAPAPTATSTLSLHDALPIFVRRRQAREAVPQPAKAGRRGTRVLQRPQTRLRPRESERTPPALPSTGSNLSPPATPAVRSEKHTSELQSREKLVCRLLLEKKK